MTQRNIIQQIEQRFGDCIAEFDKYGERLTVENINGDMPDYEFDEVAFFVQDLMPGNVDYYDEATFGGGIVFHLFDEIPA